MIDLVFACVVALGIQKEIFVICAILGGHKSCKE